MSSSLSGNATSQTFCSLYVTRSTKKTEKVTQTSQVLSICQPKVGILPDAKTVARKVVLLLACVAGARENIRCVSSRCRVEVARARERFSSRVLLETSCPKIIPVCKLSYLYF